MHKEFRGGGSKGVLGVGSEVQFWGPISLCLCAFLGLESKMVNEAYYDFSWVQVLAEDQSVNGLRDPQLIT